MTSLKKHSSNFLKGFTMGAANVIPGVSGGTIALITGIFERLINSLKAFNIKAIKLILKGKFKDFEKHTDFIFILTVFAGAITSIMTLAKILEFLFNNYPIFIWSYFFGLILASVLFVGKTIEKWNFGVITAFITGAAIAITITVLKPANENSSFLYLILCGIVAISSMILPGLSGSFILILMGNYKLIMIKSINNLSNAFSGDFSTLPQAIKIITPVAIGVIIGLLAFSHLLSWVYKKFKNQTIAILTGFILGSLTILWPWKHSYNSSGELLKTNMFGKIISKTTDLKVFAYEKFFPEINSILFITIAIMILGIATIWIIERTAEKTTKYKKKNPREK